MVVLVPREPMIKTHELRLYALREEDGSFLASLMNTPGWLRFIGDRGVRNELQAQEYIREYFLPLEQEVGYGYYLITTNDGKGIGVAGFLQKDYLENPDLGFAMAPDSCRRGYAYQACLALLDFVSEKFAQHGIDAVTDSENRASISLLNKLGFILVREDKEGDGKLLIFHRNAKH